MDEAVASVLGLDEEGIKLFAFELFRMSSDHSAAVYALTERLVQSGLLAQLGADLDVEGEYAALRVPRMGV